MQNRHFDSAAYMNFIDDLNQILSDFNIKKLTTS